MSREVTQLEKEIQALSIEEKRDLLRVLVADLDELSEPHVLSEPQVERAWLEAAQRRHQELAGRESKGVPANLVFDEVRSRLGR